FDEKLRTGSDVTLVQRVQQGVTGPVSGGTGALHGLFTEVGRVATKRTLVNSAIRVAIERHAEVFEFVNGMGCFTAHVFNRVLVAEPVGALDGVEHVPVPVVFAHVAQRSTNTSLRGNRVRTRGEHFGQYSHGQPGLCKLQRATHTGSAGAHNHHIKLAAG